MTAAERKEWRREAEVEGNELVRPTSLMVIWTVIWRDEREEAVGGGRRLEERDFLREGERRRKVSLVAEGS